MLTGMTDSPFDHGRRASAYLDHAATSPLRPEVWSAMASVLGEADANPASPHARGQGARRHLEDARRRIAELLGVPRSDLVFTSGGTAADNLAVLGFARAHRGRSPRLLVSAIEHKAVLGAASRAADEGASVERIPVDRRGTIELDALEAALREEGGRPTLVSVMWANNEVGTIQPVAEATRLAHDHGALLHTDAVQALGKTGCSVGDVPVDLLSVTAHKLGGPVGIGALYVREGVELAPLMHGGTQEGSLWPGTQNPVAAVGFAEAAARLVDELPEHRERWSALRDRLARGLTEAVPDLVVHGEEAPRRLPQLLSVGLPGCDTSSLLVSLDLEGLAVSSGSACSSGSASPSHVLEAMGVDAPADRYGVLRFSFGPETGEAAVERALEVVPRVAARLRGAGTGVPGG